MLTTILSFSASELLDLDRVQNWFKDMPGELVFIRHACRTMCLSLCILYGENRVIYATQPSLSYFVQY